MTTLAIIVVFLVAVVAMFLVLRPPVDDDLRHLTRKDRRALARERAQMRLHREREAALEEQLREIRNLPTYRKDI